MDYKTIETYVAAFMLVIFVIGMGSCIVASYVKKKAEERIDK